MEYNRYQRHFIMLEPQEEKFIMKHETSAQGHLKIETGGNKGALRVGVQNIKPFEKQEYIYKLILFGKEEEKTIYAIIGTVNVGSAGSGDTYFRFNPLDIDGKGNNLSKFTYAIIAAVSRINENEALHPVLKGLIDIKGEESRVTSETDKNAKDKVVGKESWKEDEMVRDNMENSYEDDNRIIEKNNENQRELETLQGTQVKSFNSFYNVYLLEKCEEIEKTAEIYDRILPFKNDVTDAVWNKINSPTTIPIISPGGKNLSEKYRHYIFGVSERFYYIGVPGRFLRKEQPEEGASGFLLWQPILGAETLNATSEECSDEARLSAYGYWIVAIKRSTGDIVEA